jgi:myo-inositol-1(or 4)-monophosphatase
MDIDYLKSIGRTLMKEIPAARLAPARKDPVGIGAAGDRSFAVDMLAEEIILTGLQKLKEPLTIVSEETGIMELEGGGTRVMIDPVDGSKNAVAGLPFYCTSIAVADGDILGKVRLSYVINLSNGDEFWAEACAGAWFNGRRMQTQDTDMLYLVCYEAQVPGRDILAIAPLLAGSRRTRCMGATALDLAYLACGASSVFVAPSLSRSFDFAGGWLLVKEAGGIITDASGEEIENAPLDLKKSSSLLAAGNRSLHRKALALLSQAGKYV